MSNHLKIKFPKPDFDSLINELILKIEVLKNDRVYLDVNPILFFQLNRLFHSIE